MPDKPVAVTTIANDMVITLHGEVGEDCAADLRHALVRAVRHTKPSTLTVELVDVTSLDPINTGVLAAVAQLADVHNIRVVVMHEDDGLAGALRTAGLPGNRLSRRGPALPRQGRFPDEAHAVHR